MCCWIVTRTWSVIAAAICVSAVGKIGRCEEFPKAYDTQEISTPLLSPREALDAISVPRGFHVTLYAAEPDVRQPIALTTDERGRLWVVENYTYAESKVNFETEKQRDRILIFEDTDCNGEFDKRTVFWDESWDASPSPFQSYLTPPTSEFIFVGSQDSTRGVAIDGEIPTPVVYSGSSLSARDLQARWRDETGAWFELELSNEQQIGVNGFINADGFIVIEGTGNDLLGLQFTSKQGLLSTEANPDPFSYYLVNDSTNVAMGVLGAANAIALDQPLVTSVRYLGSNPAEDLTALWGDASGAFYEFDVRRDACGVPTKVADIDRCATNIAERDAILAELGLLPGDLDGDGAVGFADFLILADNFAKSANYMGGDIDFDGTVSFADFLVLADNFGKQFQN